ncbi:adenylate/guanylate cyclase domain-containing protein [Microscilla marina]|uniref:Adenylate cyclase n=1 Tax=Microscilla marina ATCC 23134 TaxID=313606 RepID=A1ZXW2_MICM2|nr:adenylate/guanylate cyclase domain-containing protein [Microscilla marina]EAY24791.1 adenylate cyclase [Microscilla marina ATCC 23134]
MKATILIVDDEVTNLKILREYLTTADQEFRILQATNGKQAFDIAQKADPDLVIMDWMMPVMSGIDALKNIKTTESTQNIPVIMATAKTSAQDLKEALEAGAMDYVRKPIDKTELLARVRSAIQLSHAYKQSEELLLNILPKEIAEELKAKGTVAPKPYELATVLFTDFKGFTSVAARMKPIDLLKELNACFDAFDEIIEKHEMERIKTIGDAYMCVGGVPNANTTNPVNAVLAALEMQRFMKQKREEKASQGENYWQCRLGINSGEVIAGVIGRKKFAYDIWGDTVNSASRMESNGEAGKVNISGSTHALVKDLFECEHRGKINAKGKGEVDMYFVLGIKPEYSINNEGVEPNELFYSSVGS